MELPKQNFFHSIILFCVMQLVLWLISVTKVFNKVKNTNNQIFSPRKMCEGSQQVKYGSIQILCFQPTQYIFFPFSILFR